VLTAHTATGRGPRVGRTREKKGMALDARKEVGAREVAIVVMPLLTLLASAGLLFRSLPALEVLVGPSHRVHHVDSLHPLLRGCQKRTPLVSQKLGTLNPKP